MDKGTAQVNIRRLAVQALLQINRDGAYANIVLQQMLGDNKLSDVDRRFFTELVYGVVRRRNYLDAIICLALKRGNFASVITACNSVRFLPNSSIIVISLFYENHNQIL